jgi:molybdopterin synthase sulfur carrier subunit
MIEVKFFASLRELVKTDSITLEVQSDLTVEQVWQRATSGIPFPNNVLCAINLEYTALDHIVNDNDEVAFFPPVTGG